MFCFNPSQVQFTLRFFSEVNPRFNEFQSLTGSIHTRLLDGFDLLDGYVSIPHRFNSHPEALELGINIEEMFQSLTGSIHTNAKTLKTAFYG